jgi:hypothetical protein
MQTVHGMVAFQIDCLGHSRDVVTKICGNNMFTKAIQHLNDSCRIWSQRYGRRGAYLLARPPPGGRLGMLAADRFLITVTRSGMASSPDPDNISKPTTHISQMSVFRTKGLPSTTTESQGWRGRDSEGEGETTGRVEKHGEKMKTTHLSYTRQRPET